jgi:tRNA pseudouridine55 synthase
MDGVLLIDKPSGPTSHDVVARIRQASGERSVGHTGTLDPRATGLLPLVLGRATRLASIISSGDKAYDAEIRLGFATDTDDAAGKPLGEPSPARPSDAALDAALEAFRGTFEQVPPSHSAKKVDGHKAYDLARRDASVPLKAVTVTVHELERTGRTGDLVMVRVVATAGFYVRALARDLGQKLGCGAHLATLRRTRSGTFGVAAAIPLAVAERLGAAVQTHLMPASEALGHLPAVEVSAAGLKRVVHGNPIGPQHVAGRWVALAGQGSKVRILGPDGRLVALAESKAGALHPVVVLG